MNDLKQIIESIGSVLKVSELLGVSHSAIHRWLTANALPRTEWTGKTDYAQRLSLCCWRKVQYGFLNFI